MNKLKNFLSIILFTLMIVTTINCKKEEGASTACKTCKAIGAGADQQTIERQVCTDADETAFRNEFSGREISCQ
jgi:hypothetical protein